MAKSMTPNERIKRVAALNFSPVLAFDSDGAARGACFGESGGTLRPTIERVAVAKLNRLSRDVHFGLMAHRVPFLVAERVRKLRAGLLQ